MLEYNIRVIIVIIILIIAYLYSIKFAVFATKNRHLNKLLDFFHVFHKKCAIKCTTDTCANLTTFRGKQYYIADNDSNNDNIKYCIATFWSIAHFTMFLIIGLLLPEHPIIAICGGIIFEIYEYFAFKCHDALDIFWNTSGFAIGYTIAKIFFKYH